MKKSKWIPPVLLLAVLFLELLPFGAVLNFANPEGEAYRRTYSYFDLTVYGYANFGPFLCALLTSVLLILSFVNLKRNWEKPLGLLSALALLFSLAPLCYGLDSYSVIGGVISLLLLALTLFFFLPKKS